MGTGALGVVEDWLDAVDRADGDRLEELTHERVEIVGPRGRGVMERGELTGWLARAGFSARTLRWFCGGDGVVVVEQDARWVERASGLERGRARLASRFVVRQGRIAAYVRHDDGVASALEAAGLDERAQVTERRAP